MATKIVQLHDKVEAVCPIDGVSIGRWEDKTSWSFHARPEATDAQKAAVQAVVDAFDINTPDIPDEVSMMQAQLALLSAGLLDQVNAAISGSGNAQWQLIWSKATTIRRDSSMMNQLAQALNLTASQVDQLFITAAGIQP